MNFVNTNHMEIFKDENRYEALIKRALPKTIVNRANSFDDEYWGFEVIIPEDMYLMHFMIDKRDPSYIKIKVKEISMHEECQTDLIYNGYVPTCKRGGLWDDDLSFIRKIVRNYLQFVA